MKQKHVYDVIVIGGGASGMMAAGTAARLGKRVLVLEKNAKLGEKLAITGGKRCNILNAEDDEKKLLSNFGKAEQFLYSAFSKCGMRESYEFFESRGLPLKVEARKRAFPVSEKAKDVVDFFRTYLAEGKVSVLLNSPVTFLKRKGSNIEYVEAAGNQYTASSYILATGGMSHPETGSTGDGFTWLKELGHTVEKPTPTIVPLKTAEAWVKDVAGVTVANAKIFFLVDKVKSFSKTGPLLFTHNGVSGPTILNSSQQVATLLQEGEVKMYVDFFPSIDLGILDQQLTALFDEHKNKTLKNVFKDFAPAGVSGAILALVRTLDPDAKVHSITREQRRTLVELLKSLPLTITGLLGFEKAVVADGGIPLTEIDMRTMRSKKIENLFILGDLLHISRPSGGYSLQLCWTTGYVAGTEA